MSKEAAKTQQKLQDIYKTADQLPESERDSFLRKSKKEMEKEAVNEKKTKDSEMDSIKAEYAAK